MKPFVMQARQQAYLELLNHGLSAIRRLAYAEKAALCEIEADHLHNIPSLFHEANEARHHYYIVQERKLYLEKLEKHGDTEYAQLQFRFYQDPWKVLMTLAIDELDPTRSSRSDPESAAGGEVNH